MPKGVYKRKLFTEETRRHMSDAQKGKHHSEEHCRKLSEARNRWLSIPENIDRHREYTQSYEFRNKIREVNIGKIRPNRGKSKYTHEEQLEIERRRGLCHTQWRKSILKIDGKRCFICSSKEYLHAHHILPFSLFPESQLDLGNGVTLCEECHNKYHTKYGKGIHCNCETLKKFARDLFEEN